MKKITNWRSATVADFEADGLLDEATKLHVLSYQLDGKGVNSFHGAEEADRIKAFFRYHLEKKIPIVMHSGISYDIPLAEKLLDIDLSEIMLIDSLALSWYLNTNRPKHGLDSFHEDYGIEKPKIDDWENLSYEEYRHRCQEDVKINKALWEDLKARLIDMYTFAQAEINAGHVGGTRMFDGEEIYLDQFVGSTVDEAIDRILTFLMFKMDCARLQEKTRWDVDVELLESSIEELTEEGAKAKAELESVMPMVPKYSERKKPAKPFKKNGDLSASGEAWEEVKKLIETKAVDEHGNPMVKPSTKEGAVKVLTGYEPPNGNSPDQIKAFLFSKGWVPQSFKYEKDEEAFNKWIASKPREGASHQAWDAWKAARPEERAIPQITVAGDEGKELCPSLEELAEEVPEIRVYAKYCVLKHRLGVLNGFKRDMKNGKLQARIAGLTNTLRMQHAEIVNLAGVDKAYGKIVRGVLVAGKGKVCLGSDLSSLEDRVKHHLMLPHDPEYVATMQEDDFDPHILMALTAKMITQEEYDEFKKGNKTANAKAARKKGKTCLPVDNTEVLTSRGWLRGADVVVGDSVMSLNAVTNTLEWCKVTDTVLFKEQSTVVMKNHNWELESTPDHKWVVDRTTGRGSTRRVVREWVATEKLNKAMNIVTTAPYVGGSSHVTVAQARVVGWVLADGSLSVSPLTHKTSQGLSGNKQAVRMTIAQAKFYEDVKEDIKAVGLDYSEYRNSSNVPVFQFKSESARNFLKGVGLPLEGKHEIDYSLWVSGLSKEALAGFYDAFWKADGNTASPEKRYSTSIVYQNSGNIADAVHLASVLMGKNTFKRFNKEGYGVVRSQARSSVTMQKVTKAEGRVVDVFCLTTENTSFLIRQNGFITITGNCNYASVYNAGAAKIAQAAGVPLKEGEALHEAYWKLNWAVKAIAEEQVVIKDSRGNKWLVNPVNGFCYALRKESDRFSTLAQGTGAFFFDMWLDNCLNMMHERYGAKTLTGQFHDEHIFTIRDKEKFVEEFKGIIQLAIEKVNEDFKLRRKLGCETQVGYRYSDIH